MTLAARHAVPEPVNFMIDGVPPGGVGGRRWVGQLVRSAM